MELRNWKNPSEICRAQRKHGFFFFLTHLPPSTPTPLFSAVSSLPQPHLPWAEALLCFWFPNCWHRLPKNLYFPSPYPSFLLWKRYWGNWPKKKHVFRGWFLEVEVEDGGSENAWVLTWWKPRVPLTRHVSNGLCQWGNNLLRQSSKVPQTHTHNIQKRGKGRVPVISYPFK